MIILDTNVLSALMRQEPDPPVLQWLDLQASLADAAPFTATLRACAAAMTGLKPQLRNLLNYHCGVKTLRTRQLMIDLQQLNP